jgi:hypothetical protein
MDIMTPEKKAEIDRLGVYTLLHDNRFAPIGDPRFQGEEGEYRMERLAYVRSLDNDAYVRASKDMGWTR